MITCLIPAAKKDSKSGHEKDGKHPEDFANGRGLRNMCPAVETGAPTVGDKPLHSVKSQNQVRSLLFGKATDKVFSYRHYNKTTNIFIITPTIHYNIPRY